MASFTFVKKNDLYFTETAPPKMAILDFQILKNPGFQRPAKSLFLQLIDTKHDCLNRNPAELVFEGAQPHKEPFLLLLFHCHVTRTANEHSMHFKSSIFAKSIQENKHTTAEIFQTENRNLISSARHNVSLQLTHVAPSSPRDATFTNTKIKQNLSDRSCQRRHT